MKRYTMIWTSNRGKESRVSPHVNNRCEALVWLMKLKPEVLRCLADLIVKEWDRNDPR